MTSPSPTTPTTLAAQQRAARRALIKAHHPDRGGDPARFVELLAAFDQNSRGPVRLEARSFGSRRRARRQLVMTLRQRLPRRVPGARRYASY